MQVKGENYQNLSRFLTLAESSKSEKEFFAFVSQSQKLDERDFTCVGRSYFEENYVLIFGQHIKSRNYGRVFLTDDQLLKLVDSELKNPLALAQVLNTRVCFDEDTNGIIGFDDPDIESTAVAMEGSNYIIIFEAGFRYIRVKTIWDTRDGVFFVDEKTKAIKVTKGNGIELNINKIPEIKPNTRKA